MKCKRGMALDGVKAWEAPIFYRKEMGPDGEMGEWVNWDDAAMAVRAKNKLDEMKAHEAIEKVLADEA